jgi:hypothetical protein
MQVKTAVAALQTPKSMSPSCCCCCSALTEDTLSPEATAASDVAVLLLESSADA